MHEWTERAVWQIVVTWREAKFSFDLHKAQETSKKSI